ADVVLFYAGNQQKAEETQAEIEQLGRKALALQVDVSKQEQVTNAFRQVLSTFDRIDVLVNNAGITRDQLAVRIKEDDWDEVVNINLKGAFLCSQAVIRPMMKQRDGRIIN